MYIKILKLMVMAEDGGDDDDGDGCDDDGDDGKIELAGDLSPL